MGRRGVNDTDNDELRALFEEDQDDARTFRGDEAFVASQARRGQVEALVAAGALRTAADHYHAARLFQHGERLEHWWRAHELARAAVALGHEQARYAAAAALDRWLMRQGRPQRYGTNSVVDGDRWRVWDYDPATTDAERAAWDVPPLAELLARGERAFGGLSVRESSAGPFVTVELHGLRLELRDEPGASPPVDGPILDLPAYAAFREGVDPRPASLPADLTPWRYGTLHCATEREGVPRCSWHRCSWRLPDAPAGTAEAIFAELGATPQPLDRGASYWSRLAVATGPATCWIVGGRLPPAALARLAAGLL